MKYRIVSDSSSNLFNLPGNIEYRTVPLKILVDDIEFVDEEGINIADLTAHMKTTKKPSSTSCPNSYDWMQAFDGADTIFAVTISAALSGSYNSAMHAKEVFLGENPDANVHIINSKATGGTMQLILERLQECMEKGLSFDAIVEAITEYQKHAKILFALESLNNLAKNGRCNPALAKIAGILGIRFIGKASDEGTIQQAAIARGAKKTISTIYSEMEKNGYIGGKVVINHCLNPDSAFKLKDYILVKYPNADIKVCQSGGLCSYYSEEGGMIIGFEDL